jgi:NAD(P)-dependent dehydrogenase (short-subunit alcohol dehydrogenase family)
MSARPYQLEGRRVLITGAGSGIGRALAIELAARGCRLALCDINAIGLDETAALANGTGKISQHILDVSDARAINVLPASISAAYGGLDVLINNASVAIGGAFEEASLEDFEWLMSVNFWGVVRMSRAFLPLLRASDDARLVNLSSIFGIIAPPGQSAYSASKFAVRGFSMALSQELEGTSVRVTTVHPGGVATNIAKDARIPATADHGETEQRRREIERLLKMQPERAARIILKGVEQRKTRILVGDDAKVAALMERLAPTGYPQLLARLTRA